MEITNYNFQLRNTAVMQNSISNSTSSTQMENYQKVDVQTNSDVFTKGNYASENTGIYTLKDVATTSQKSQILTSKTAAIQTNSTNTPNVCLDTIKRAAAKKAGISLSSTGVPSINGGTAASLYFGEISRINNCFYCQTGGWSKFPNNGKSCCARTAAATMASINSGYTVTPDDTTGTSDYLTGITVNGSEKPWKSMGTYSTSTGAASGLCHYSCGSEDGVIAAINNELKAGRSVMVKTTVSGQHWVTVTGTKDGNYADSFDDFVGIDPWYNGNNPGNLSTGIGSGATNANRAGVIQLSDVTNQNLHSDYSIITFKS